MVLFIVFCRNATDLAPEGCALSKQVLLSHVYVYGSIKKPTKQQEGSR